MNITKNRLLRAITSAAVISLLPTIGLGAAANAATPTTISVKTAVAPSPSVDSYTAQVLNLINQKRAAVGAKPVKWNQSIGNVSQDWAVHLGEETKDPNFDFADIHRTDAGGSLIPKGATWYRENIAFNFTAAQIVDWWMSSPGHKASMLDARATDIGIGYVVPTSGPYAGWHLVVSNLAAYPSSTGGTTTPITTPKVLNTVDTSGNLWAYNAPGNSTLGSRTQLGSGWGSVEKIVSVDWDQDGTLDLVTKWNNGYITFYKGIGNNDYKDPVNIGSGWQGYDITVTKLRSGDKYPGVVARNVSTGVLYYYTNPSGYSIGSRITIGSGGWATMTEINALDWDKDGKMDLVVRNSAGQLLLYRTDGNGNIVYETRPVIGTGWGIFDSINAVPDFAGTGTVGLLAQTPTGTVRYYPINNGSFGAMTTPGTTGWTGYNLAEGVIDIK